MKTSKSAVSLLIVALITLGLFLLLGFEEPEDNEIIDPTEVLDESEAIQGVNGVKSSYNFEYIYPTDNI